MISFPSIKGSVPTAELVFCYEEKQLNLHSLNEIRMEAVCWFTNDIINQKSENSMFRIRISNRKGIAWPTQSGQCLPILSAPFAHVRDLHVSPIPLCKLTLFLWVLLLVPWLLFNANGHLKLIWNFFIAFWHHQFWGKTLFRTRSLGCSSHAPNVYIHSSYPGHITFLKYTSIFLKYFSKMYQLRLVD